MESKAVDFFKKGGIKTFAGGKSKGSAVSERFRTKVMAAIVFLSGVAAPSLTSAFAQQKQTKHVYRPPIEKLSCKTSSGETLTYRVYNGYGDSTHVSGIKEIVDAAAATLTGEAVLKPFMQKNGVISARYGLGNVCGAYQAKGNIIYLNADFFNAVEDGRAYLKTTIVHEAAHAKQNYAGMSLTTEMNTATLFRTGRASEADANTHQIFAAEEMAAAGDTAVWNALLKDKPLMMQAFLKARKGGKNDAATAKETMLAYYADKKYVDIYDDNYARISENKGAVDKSDAALRAQRNVSPAEIAAKICTIKGKPYLGADAGALLADSLRSALTEEIYARLEKSAEEHASALKRCGVNAKTDASHKAFFVRQKNGTVRHPEKTAVISAAVRNKTAGR